ncbi:uncharacterized protein LOC131251147 [Magnolia sinica]|uniref:uncharacterized protein LOC131251147 n=1 Tax=Magnolia sinica TaxID=86752 RepID=UPI00265AD553|nr:uncharacterized protein LOC131251147 [Magnolia sinica]XP_058107663.1 uncharacterized protein LOC131251147 [Magnolia sinica]XP_058107664.1 uncharacterized protein LOC131251147 [Magnolia sinica]
MVSVVVLLELGSFMQVSNGQLHILDCPNCGNDFEIFKSKVAKPFSKFDHVETDIFLHHLIVGHCCHLESEVNFNKGHHDFSSSFATALLMVFQQFFMIIFTSGWLIWSFGERF